MPQLAGRIHLGRYVEDQEDLEDIIFNAIYIAKSKRGGCGMFGCSSSC